MSKADLCDINETNKWVKYYENKGYNVVLVNLSDNNDYKKVIDLINKVAKNINLKRKEKGLKEKELKILNLITIPVILLSYLGFIYLTYNPPHTYIFYDITEDKYSINDYIKLE